eukprot:360979-Chlamydomonas_euryale.AAC.6
MRVAVATRCSTANPCGLSAEVGRCGRTQRTRRLRSQSRSAQAVAGVCHAAAQVTTAAPPLRPQAVAANRSWRSNTLLGKRARPCRIVRLECGRHANC